MDHLMEVEHGQTFKQFQEVPIELQLEEKLKEVDEKTMAVEKPAEVTPIKHNVYDSLATILNAGKEESPIKFQTGETTMTFIQKAMNMSKTTDPAKLNLAKKL